MLYENFGIEGRILVFGRRNGIRWLELYLEFWDRMAKGKMHQRNDWNTLDGWAIERFSAEMALAR